MKFTFKLMCCVFILLPVGKSWAEDGSFIKSPNVAGSFYNADPNILTQQIDGFLAGVAEGEIPQEQNIQIAIVPHAGYGYSGGVAAHAFKALARGQYSTIVIVALSHFYPFDGAALWSKGGFQTPLGVIPVDQDFTKELLALTPVFKDEPKAFTQEHSLEVELPFIQRLFPDVRIVPILMGQPDFKVAREVAVAIHQVMKDRGDALVLISSDMSHYHPYKQANAMDQDTLRAIEAQDVEGLWNGIRDGRMEMCGFVPVTVGILLSQMRGLTQVKILKYANSGDVTGDQSRVVGYGAVIFTGPRQGKIGEQDKRDLLKFARATIELFVKTGKSREISAEVARFSKIQGAFVTVMKKGQLRGCIGTIIGQKPLNETIRDMAIAAASKDPRFNPITGDELNDLTIEISVLSPVRRIKDAAEIVLGRDGVIISDGKDHQGVFLPQVAQETGWSKEEFLSELSTQKAGLSSEAWKDPQNQLYTFTAEVFSE